MYNKLILLQYLLLMDIGGINTTNYATKDCIVFDSKTAIRSCNRVCNLLPISVQDINKIKCYFSSIPFSWLIAESDSASKELLEHQGLCTKFAFPAMIKSLSNAILNDLPHEVTVKSVDMSSLAEWTYIVSDTFKYDEDQLVQFVKYISKELASEDVRFYIAMYNNVSVSACMIVCHPNGVVSIHMVATLTEYQGKGFAQTLTEYVLNDSYKRGCAYAVLLASDKGFRLYSKLGFTMYERYVVYGNYE
jgi:ribosomal protein S18 acetylase RimI-like enzyme